MSWSNINTEKNLSQMLFHFIVQVQQTYKWWHKFFRQGKCFIFFSSRSLLSYCTDPSPLSIQMCFIKVKFCRVTECQLHVDLQVKLALEEGVLIPKEALTEGLTQLKLNSLSLPSSSPKPQIQTLCHTSYLPYTVTILWTLPTTTQSMLARLLLTLI